MKLEVKHLAPYLPYGLKCKNLMGSIVTIQGLKIGSESVSNELFIYRTELGGYFTGYLYQCKPILRPMSDLELDDHSDFNEKYYFSFGGYEGLMLKGVNGTYTRLMEVDYLFENHFDVFGLIDQGLAIDINTLNNNDEDIEIDNFSDRFQRLQCINRRSNS